MAFDDDQHPRGDDGKFIETGGQKLQTWGKNRPPKGVEPRERSAPDERVPRVGDFMRTATKEAAANPGGFTVRPGYSKPTTGTIVSLPTSAGLNLQFQPGERASRDKLREWVKKARGYLRTHDNTYIGGWKNEQGKIYLDVNERYSDHAKAMKLGKERNQEGVFNLTEANTPRPASLSADAPWGYHPTGGTGA